MSPSAIIWNTRSNKNSNSIFFKYIKRSIKTYCASTLQDLNRLLQEHPDVSTVIVVLGSDDLGTLRRLQELKEKNPSLLFYTTFLSRPAVADMGISSQQIHQLQAAFRAGRAPNPIYFEAEQSARLLEDLTVLQLDILILLARGKAGKEIARLINIPNAEVAEHCEKIYEALKVSNMAEASRRAKEVLTKLQCATRLAS